MALVSSADRAHRLMPIGAGSGLKISSKELINIVLALHITFWLALLISVFSYFVYPVTLRLLPSRKQTSPSKNEVIWPSISVIVAAHNEQGRLAAKLDNLLALDRYPGDVEILVASDASTDSTDNIVQTYANCGVKLIRNPERKGKEAAQALAISVARGEVLVFSDVATYMQGDALFRIASHFADPETGAISSTDAFIDREGNVSGEGTYVRYEMWLREQECRVNSLVGLSGSFFAVRASICRKAWQTDIPSDFMVAINCVRQGFVAQLASDVIGYYKDLAEPEREYQRKVRTVTRGIVALAKNREVLNPLKYGLFAYQIWGHKLLRWMVPWSLVLLMVNNLLLLGSHVFYVVSLFGQLVFYALAFAGWLAKGRAGILLGIPCYFVSSNIAVAHAVIQFLRGESYINWTPSKR